MTNKQRELFITDVKRAGRHGDALVNRLRKIRRKLFVEIVKGLMLPRGFSGRLFTGKGVQG